MTLLHPRVECCIFRHNCLRRIPHSHHCEEVLCDHCLQKFGCMCETLLVNYPQMSSARGRALSEQRRHPIHRAKKPWTNTKRPASNQPQNKRGETQAIANDINSKSCRDQHSTLRAMPKFPNGSLHKNKPSMNTIHVSIHTRNDPPKPSHKKLTRLGRDIHVAWTTRTRPSNMVKTANVMTTRPNTSVSNIKILGTVQRSRRKRTPCCQSTRLRPRSRKLPNTIPINSVKQTVFKAIKIIVPPSGLTLLHLKVECCIVRSGCLRKLPHSHHCEEVLCEHGLQNFGCMTLLHPKVECCTVHLCFFRKLPHAHHCKEVLCDDSLQKPWTIARNNLPRRRCRFG